MTTLPIWMTVADGTGLEPPADYIGPMRRSSDGLSGVLLAGSIGYYQGSGNIRVMNQDAEVSDSRWLLDLDRPEGSDAALRKLAKLNDLPLRFSGPQWEYLNELQWNLYGEDSDDEKAHGPIVVFASKLFVPHDPVGVRVVEVPGISKVNDPVLALAMALAVIGKKP